MTRSTPRSSAYTASRHQKQPPANVAVSVRAELSIVAPMSSHTIAPSMAEAEPGGDGGEAGLAQSTAYNIEGGVELRALGAEIDYKWGYYYARVPGGLRGADLRLAEASVTGTENLLMSAVLAQGRTTIRNAAAEPEVDNLIDFLNALGGRVRRLETDVHTIEVDGVPRGSLHGARIDVIPDRVEAGSFAMAAAVTGGELVLEGARADHLGAVLAAW